MRHTLVALASRRPALHDEIKTHTRHLKTLTKTAAPQMLERFDIGFDNTALYRIVLARMSGHAETRNYVRRRRTQGLNTAEIMRCFRRYVARQTFKHLPRTTCHSGWGLTQ